MMKRTERTKVVGSTWAPANDYELTTACAALDILDDVLDESPRLEELVMMIRAGVTIYEFVVARDRFNHKHSDARDPWPWLRTVAWGEAVRRVVFEIHGPTS